MADKKNGYVGQIKHTGSQKVTAPNPGQTSKGKSTVKKGDDLRKG